MIEMQTLQMEMQRQQMASKRIQKERKPNKEGKKNGRERKARKFRRDNSAEETVAKGFETAQRLQIEAQELQAELTERPKLAELVLQEQHIELQI